MEQDKTEAPTEVTKPSQETPVKDNHQQQQKPDTKQEQPQNQSEPQQIGAEEVKVQQQPVEEETQLEQLIEDLPERANEHKQKGNQFFKEGNYDEAIAEYQKGLSYTGDKALRCTMLSNMGICFIKMESYAYGEKYCQRVLKEDENHVKARINLARCYEELKKIDEAYEQYKKVEARSEGVSPSDTKFVADKIKYLQPKVDALNESRKKEVVDGLKSIGNSILGYFGMSLDNFKFEQGPNGGYNISMKQ